MKVLGVVVLSIVSAGCSVFGIRGEETPNYNVVEKDGDFEIREYEPYIVAKTTVDGDFEEAQGKGFRILANYIFGGNLSKQEISMTAPVQMEKPQSQKISMTAPVEQKKTDNGWTMTFMMPSKYKMDELPIPNDDRVKIEEVPGKTIAVIRYSWGRGKERNDTKAQLLIDWLNDRKKYEIKSEPYYAGYDPPWTLWPFRRNEMMIEVGK